MPKKIRASERNKYVYNALKELFLKSSSTKYRFPSSIDGNLVELLFQTKVFGHREILLTIVMAMIYDPKYKATRDLYACNPRSLYEKPIRTVLREENVPHKKSGPLNVAKNTKSISKSWAAGKHEEHVALAVVDIVSKLEKLSKKDLQKFALAYVSRYRQEAIKVKELHVNVPVQENPVLLSKLCISLIKNVPDGGATAQTIIGLLLVASNKLRTSNRIQVEGHLDSVSTTNTTSKKPGDIIEYINDEDMLIYEVTTKKFNEDRLRESHESVLAYDKNINSVFVVCENKDIPDMADRDLFSEELFIKAFVSFSGINYFFINIYEYMQSLLLFMTAQGRSLFFQELTSYINKVNTSEKVKKYFKLWCDENLA